MKQKNADSPENTVKVKGRARLGWPMFESLGQCAAATGAPESLLKSAKRKGCTAFLTHGRIDSGILLPFLFKLLEQGTDLPAGFASWKEVLESERAKREMLKRQADEKTMLPADEVLRENGAAWALVFAEMERLCNEMPPALAGLSAIEVCERLTEFKENMRKLAQEKFEGEKE